MREPPATSNCRQCWPSTSLMGVLAVSRFSSISRNTGVSSTPRRSHRPNSTSATLETNGTRQPQAWKSSGLRKADTTAMKPVPISVPQDGPTCVNDALRPRWFGLPCSIDSSTAPAHSPPRATPCTKRNATSATGAHTPHEA
ncbi:hypothetical protein D3C87_1605630 [compost metagenome]